MLLTHLPADSAYVRAVYGDEAAWGLAEHLQALTIDVLQQANWQRAAQHSRSRVPMPQPIPRPGVDSNTGRLGKTKLTPDQVKAWFAAMSAPREGSEDA